MLGILISALFWAPLPKPATAKEKSTQEAPSKRAAVRLAPARQKPAAAPVQVQAVQTEQAPKNKLNKVSTATAAPLVEARPEPQEKLAAAEPEPRIELAPYHSIVQPAINPLSTYAVVQAEALPPLPTLAEVPEAPPDDYAPPPVAYLEKSGGDVLVLGLRINDQGSVLETKILVKSYRPLEDLSWALVSLKDRFEVVDPPLKPGEFRWLEVRISYPAEKPSLLP
jgi:hypothetical protein